MSPADQTRFLRDLQRVFHRTDARGARRYSPESCRRALFRVLVRLLQRGSVNWTPEVLELVGEYSLRAGLSASDDEKTMAKKLARFDREHPVDANLWSEVERLMIAVGSGEYADRSRAAAARLLGAPRRAA
ncbi:MAG: hypothetical protein HY791_34805 [Deltaproteobacteria bacterium]|nr:hypothetical protein [Deltaproteobacteria bacterium]